MWSDLALNAEVVSSVNAAQLPLLTFHHRGDEASYRSGFFPARKLFLLGVPSRPSWLGGNI